jgi:hypothetical protein
VFYSALLQLFEDSECCPCLAHAERAALAGSGRSLSASAGTRLQTHVVEEDVFPLCLRERSESDPTPQFGCMIAAAPLVGGKINFFSAFFIEFFTTTLVT